MSYHSPNILLLDAPVGLDAVIQSYQQDFYLGLPWLRKSFGRAWEQPEQGRRIPKAYIGQKEYYNVLPNDSLISQSFISVRTPEELNEDNEEGVERTLAAVFWFNLEAINPALDSVFTEQIRWDIERLIEGNRFTAEILEVHDERHGDIFLGYIDNDMLEEGRQYLMYPYAGLRIDFRVGYDRRTDCVQLNDVYWPLYSSISDIEATVTGATYQNDVLKGKKIRLFRGGVKQSRSGPAFYAFDASTGTITANPAFDNEQISVEIYGNE
jgi:hypothetical protein